ncbi:DNA-3-methyladenine glycosylase I [Saccharospirillum mangrovi]|uniref:DNA-3-methyladenine glycosylase I n=1 Tax=Saccharospirillum mangrovi TaxID=2161747 RepID=UPI001E494533|nr:DNA-3-methyladenine glycosylase I [Saccharospirillum mangrovi]
MTLSFAELQRNALAHHDQVDIEDRMPTLATNEELIARSDANWLSLISRRVFRAGMKHSVIDARWPAFEEAFWQFDPKACQLIDDDRFEQLMQDDRLIRHWGKMKTIPVNALMVQQRSKQHGGFGRFIAEWPTDDIVGLWQVLAKEGAHLGGDGAARLLRMAGKDTFVLSPDPLRVLVNAGIVTRKPTAKRDLQAVQDVFNDLAAESGWPLSHLSMLMALSIGPDDR